MLLILAIIVDCWVLGLLGCVRQVDVGGQNLCTKRRKGMGKDKLTTSTGPWRDEPSLPDSEYGTSTSHEYFMHYFSSTLFNTHLLLSSP